MKLRTFKVIHRRDSCAAVNELEQETIGRCETIGFTEREALNRQGGIHAIAYRYRSSNKALTLTLAEATVARISRL